MPNGSDILNNLSDGKLSGVQLAGTFSMEQQTTIDASSINGQVQKLVLKLKETDRGTGAFQTISAAAFLEVDVDMNLIHSFNPTHADDGKDDSHSLAEAHVGTDSGIDAAKRALASQYRLDLHNFLSVADNANLSPNTEYDVASKLLTTSWFPAGAIVLDLDADDSIKDRITGNVTVQDASGADRTFLVSADQLEAGVMMFAKVKVDCAQAMPQITGITTFEPTGAVMNSDDGANNKGIKIVLTGLDNYSLAQVLTVATADGASGSIKITEATAPGASAADDFEEVIQLADLIGEGTVGDKMGDAVVAAIGQNADLIKSFKLQVDGVAHDSDGDFSGFCRQLAADPSRTQENPFVAGDKFIINSAPNLQLSVQPFQYSFSGGQTAAGGQALKSVSTINLFKSMPVYAVLKQSAAPAPMMKTFGGVLHE